MQRGCRLRSCAPMLHSGNDRFVKVIWRGANSLMDSNPRSSDTDNNGIDDYVGRRWFDRSSRYALSRWSDHDNIVNGRWRKRASYLTLPTTVTPTILGTAKNVAHLRHTRKGEDVEGFDHHPSKCLSQVYAYGEVRRPKVLRG
jgi:hypothetical protein